MGIDEATKSPLHKDITIKSTSLLRIRKQTTSPEERTAPAGDTRPLSTGHTRHPALCGRAGSRSLHTSDIPQWLPLATPTGRAVQEGLVGPDTLEVGGDQSTHFGSLGWSLFGGENQSVTPSHGWSATLES